MTFARVRRAPAWAACLPLVAATLWLACCQPGRGSGAAAPAATEERAAQPESGLQLDAARDALRRRIARLPHLDLTFKAPDVGFVPPTPAPDVVTLYMRDYAMDLPRGLFAALHNPWLFRSGAGFLTTGNCRLTIFVDEELNIAAPLRELVARSGELAGHAAPLTMLPTTALAEVWPDVVEQISFPHDYALLERLFATDFTKLDVAALSAAELIEVMFLIEIKPIVVPDGAPQYLARVTTPCYPGFYYGHLDRGERAWIDLHDHNRHRIKFILACFERMDADAALLQAALPALIGSVRPHDSDTPGADMLAAARAELASRRDNKAVGLARCLVLCASRYEDAYDGAVTLGKTLASDDWPQADAYLAVLQRYGERVPGQDD